MADKKVTCKSGIFIADTPKQLDVVKEYLDHCKSTRVRYYPHAEVEVKVLEDHDEKLLISVGGMIGWCLKKHLEIIKEENKGNKK